jgi:hypothetical protein
MDKKLKSTFRNSLKHTFSHFYKYLQERLATEDQTAAPQRSRAPAMTLGPWFPSRNEEFQVQRNARPGTPIGRPKVEGLSNDGNLVRWSMMHRYRRGGGFESRLPNITKLFVNTQTVNNCQANAFTLTLDLHIK